MPPVKQSTKGSAGKKRSTSAPRMKKKRRELREREKQQLLLKEKEKVQEIEEEQGLRMEAQCNNAAPEEEDSRTQQQREKKPEEGNKSIQNAAYRGREEVDYFNNAALLAMTEEENVYLEKVEEDRDLFEHSDGEDSDGYFDENNNRCYIRTTWGQNLCQMKAFVDYWAQLGLAYYNQRHNSSYEFANLKRANTRWVGLSLLYYLTFEAKNVNDTSSASASASSSQLFRALVTVKGKGKGQQIVHSCGFEPCFRPSSQIDSAQCPSFGSTP